MPYLLDSEVSYQFHMKAVDGLLHLVSEHLSSIVEGAAYLFNEILAEEVVLLLLLRLPSILFLLEVFFRRFLNGSDACKKPRVLFVILLQVYH